MNLVLLKPDEVEGNRAVLCGRRARHICDVIDAEPGRALRVGILGGRIGEGRVLARDDASVTLDLRADHDPPAASPVTLVLALPRPKVARRVLVDAAALGIKRIHLLGAWKVDKSYWDSPLLLDTAVDEHLVLGLEQGGDTIMPTVTRHRLFKPFVEDSLASIASGSRCLVAHPGAADACPRGIEGPLTLAVGPERGFTDYEIERLVEAGFEKVSLGPRTLRVESAVAMLLGRVA